MTEPTHVDPARWDAHRQSWQIVLDDPSTANGFIVWGAGTFGVGKTVEEATRSWRTAVEEAATARFVNQCRRDVAAIPSAVTPTAADADCGVVLYDGTQRAVLDD